MLDGKKHELKSEVLTLTKGGMNSFPKMIDWNRKVNVSYPSFLLFSHVKELDRWILSFL